VEGAGQVEWPRSCSCQGDHRVFPRAVPRVNSRRLNRLFRQPDKRIKIHFFRLF
jgi:hypothetical protein